MCLCDGIKYVHVDEVAFSLCSKAPCTVLKAWEKFARIQARLNRLYFDVPELDVPFVNRFKSFKKNIDFL